jgi:hypothetical protein
MSSLPSAADKSHAGTWAVSVIALLPLLYFLSVPFIFDHVCQMRFWRGTGTAAMPGGGFWEPDHPPPDWLLSFTKPYDFAVEHAPAGDLLERYATWVFRVTP